MKTSVLSSHEQTDVQMYRRNGPIKIIPWKTDAGEKKTGSDKYDTFHGTAQA